MLHFFIGLWLSLRDIAIAAYDWIASRKRRRYSYSLLVDAPLDKVWPLLLPVETTFEKAHMHIGYEPLEGVADGYIGSVSIGGKPVPPVAFVMEQIDEGKGTVSRYLPEYSEGHTGIGQDDYVGYTLEPVGDAQTRISSYRELTHTYAATRITAPLGMRSAAWLIKQQAELDAGKPAPGFSSRLAQQALIVAATLASFWYLVGFIDALLLVVIIALHEAGHAVAMQMTGVGVRVITLVPFFGGMAVPKRQYDSEAAHSFVAWAGPGLSLLPTLALVLWADATDNRDIAHAAVLFAIINGFNLLPIPPLDGGVMLNSVAGSLHRNLARLVLGLGALIMLGLAIYMQSVILGLVFVLAGIQLVYQVSLDVDRHRRRLRWFQWPLVLLALGGTLAAYVALFVKAERIEHPRGRLLPPIMREAPTGDRVEAPTAMRHV